MDLEKFKECQKNYLSAAADFRKEIENFFDGVLTEGNFIELEDCPCVAYDGGNHGDYASTLCSVCYGVGKKNGHVYFRLEEDSEYGIDRMMLDDLATVIDWEQESMLNQQ